MIPPGDTACGSRCASFPQQLVPPHTSLAQGRASGAELLPAHSLSRQHSLRTLQRPQARRKPPPPPPPQEPGEWQQQELRAREKPSALRLRSGAQPTAQPKLGCGDVQHGDRAKEENPFGSAYSWGIQKYERNNLLFTCKIKYSVISGYF